VRREFYRPSTLWLATSHPPSTPPQYSPATPCAWTMRRSCFLCFLRQSIARRHQPRKARAAPESCASKETKRSAIPKKASERPWARR